MNRRATQQDDRAPKARHRPTGPGMTIPRLTFAEQLVLWSARRLATLDHGTAATETEASARRQDVLARVGGELRVALRPTGGPTAGAEAAQALERTLDIFGSAGVRGLRLNPMCCRFVSNDERLFVSFLAACQEGDYRHTAALLSWFEAAQALERTLDIFGSAGVRGLRLNPMCCRFVSNDERLFVSFLAACQEGDYRHTAALLSWFLPPAAMRTAAADGAAFAAALLGAGFCLPQRLHIAASAGLSQAAPVEHAAPPTLH